MSNGLVSIILPTYNSENRIQRVIDDLSSQTYTHYEIIIVDDASSDGTWSVIEKILKSKNNIRAVRLPVNRGPAGARNSGIEVASGEFIAFMDDDDIWFPEKLNIQVRAAYMDPAIGLVGCGMHQVFSREKLEYSSVPNRRSLNFKDLLCENFLGGTISVMARTDAIREVGGFDTQFPAREEYDLWIRVSRKWKVILVPDVLMSVQHDLLRSSRISNNLNRYIEACLLLNEKYKEDISLQAGSWILRRQAEQNFFIGSQAIKIGENSKALRWYFYSFIKMPTFKSFLGMVLSPLGYRALLRMRSRSQGGR